MTSRQNPTRSRSSSTLCSSLLLLLSALLLQQCDVTQAQDCPAECTCFGTFVSCFNFTEQTLRRLPTDIDTLVLSSGNIHSFPPGFAARLGSLTLLEVQSTRAERLVNGSFSGLRGLDQLTFTDCHFGSVEVGAFDNVSAVNQLLISDTVIGVIRTGAFSRLSNLGEMKIWSSTIDKVERAAFRQLSDLYAFTFYLNNVTTMDKDAFVDISNIGKVDMLMNNFDSVRASAIIPLNAATSDMNMYSNIFPCECGLVLTFQRVTLAKYASTQKCSRPDTGEVVMVSEVDVNATCADQPETTTTTTTTSTPEPTTTTTTTTTTKPASTPSSRPVTSVSVSSKPTTTDSKATDPTRFSSTHSHGKPSPRTTPASVSRGTDDVKATGSSWTTPSSGKGLSGGGQTADGRGSHGGAGVVTQTALVPLLATVLAAGLAGSCC